MRTAKIYLAFSGIFLFLTACKKLVSVPEPINTITSTEVFSTDAQANSAMVAVYSAMINSVQPINAYNNNFSEGLSTVLGGLSSDEFFLPDGPGNASYYPFNTNHVLVTSPVPGTLWQTAYWAIYGAGSVIEGIAASTAGSLHDSVRQELTGEAKFARAFSYFYLTNFFGDVPLALTIDFNQTANMARTPQSKIYQQIIQDLKDAQAALPGDYSVGSGERIRPNKWAATALLARVYLYTGDYTDAATQASAVIANAGQYSLVSDLNGVFLANSNEAIWQLKQNTSGNLGTATAEGAALLPNPLVTGIPSFALSEQLTGAFESGDQRYANWVGESTPGMYFAYKYKTGLSSYVVGGTATEYYMVLRLAEQYLIRAEAEANGAAGGSGTAIADLNVIRQRAGLTALSTSLTQAQVITAVAHERQVELFGEWGHRWFDLKRTGQAHNVLSQIPLKQPWQGDYQLLYPIPTSEIVADGQLIQNPGYN